MLRKGQAALEFLTTYGWALLVILVMIGALVYFGLLNPSRALPDRCDVSTGWACKDFQITNTSVNIVLSNKMGEGLTTLNLNSISSDAEPGITLTGLACTLSTTSVAADADFNINCLPTAPVTSFFTGLKGEKVKVQFEIGYKPAKGTYNKTMSGSVYGPVQ